MLTLIEAAKYSRDPLQRGVIMTFPETSAVLERTPFLNVKGRSYAYNLEASLPGIQFRGLNESYDESTGVLNPQVETLVILGGNADVDRVLVMTEADGDSLRATQTQMKTKAASLAYTKKFFKGDSATNPKEFDGLERRLTGGQVLDMGSSAGGDALTLAKLDELIDAVVGGPDVLFMNKTLRRKVNALIRATGAAIETVSNVFGKQLLSYAGIPIGVIENDETDTAILDFTEECPGGGSDVGTSVYAVKFGARQYVSGLQVGPPDAIDHGLYSGGNLYRTTVEWVTGLAIFHPRSAARLRGIKNA